MKFFRFFLYNLMAQLLMIAFVIGSLISMLVAISLFPHTGFFSVAFPFPIYDSSKFVYKLLDIKLISEVGCDGI